MVRQRGEPVGRERRKRTSYSSHPRPMLSRVSTLSTRLDGRRYAFPCYLVASVWRVAKNPANTTVTYPPTERGKGGCVHRGPGGSLTKGMDHRHVLGSIYCCYLLLPLRLLLLLLFLTLGAETWEWGHGAGDMGYGTWDTIGHGILSDMGNGIWDDNGRGGDEHMMLARNGLLSCSTAYSILHTRDLERREGSLVALRMRHCSHRESAYLPPA
jgi:hypothetical protein